jgi:hypothetical protein
MDNTAFAILLAQGVGILLILIMNYYDKKRN